MAKLGPDSSEVTASAEKAAADGGRLGRFSRVYHGIRRYLFGEPEYVPESPSAAIAREADTVAALAANAPIVKVEGGVATSQELMARQARSDVADALRSVKPELSTLEDLHLIK